MTRVSREWIELGTNAALEAWPEEDCPAWQPMAEIVEAVLTATLPLIREALAAQIEARLHHGCTDYECVHAESHMAVSRAAAIVRGEV